MMTLRIRGIYAAALTQLFRQYVDEWEIVQPADEIRTRIEHAWRMDSPDVDIDDEPDDHGQREVIRLSGPAEPVGRALALLQSHCFDLITHQDQVQVGAIYRGLVGIVSHARRQAVVYMGDNLTGILPLHYADRDLPVGTRLPVRIASLPADGSERPQLSTVLTVPGRYAVLTSAKGVKLSKQIVDPQTRERLQRLGDAQDMGNWGIIWRTAAEHVADAALLEDLQRLRQHGRTLQERLRTTTAIGYIQGGEVMAHARLPGHAKAICDRLRAELLPTLPGHHKYKARGNVHSTTLEALEKELPPDVLRTRTASLSILAGLDAMQQPIQKTLRVVRRNPYGQSTDTEEGQCVGYDLEAGWVEMRRDLRHKDDYPPGLRLEKKPGDYTLTRFQEHAWQYITHFYGRSGTWKGALARITTPVAIFSDQLQMIDLHGAVAHSPTQSPQLLGLERLRQLYQEGVISEALLHKVEEEGEMLLRRLPQETLPSSPAK